MAELLIRVADKINTDDFYRNCQCTKRGDVIVASPDGWPWGKDELVLTFYRILKIPVLPLAEAQAFCAPEVDVDPLHPSRTLQKRMFRLDIDNAIIPAALKAYLQDDSRTSPSFTVNLTLTQIRSLKLVRPPITDPAVFGSPPNTF